MDILIGSNAFFSGLDGFSSKDEDWLAIQDYPLPNNTSLLNVKMDNKDIFICSPLSKEEWIHDTLNSGVPMRAGKFLVPEFVRHINFTIEDLKRLETCFENMDDKHLYEKLIYEFYLLNNDFHLTDEQRLEAFKVYTNK